MKPIYELTPISDHARETLAYIDKAKKDNKIQENFVKTGKVDVHVTVNNSVIVANSSEKEQENHNNKHEPFGKLYGEKHKGEPLFTDGQIKGLEAMYGHNRAKLVEADLRREPSTKSYRNVSLWIAIDKLEKFKDVSFEDCVIEFCNQDFAGKMYEQGCKFINCTIMYYLNATKVEYKLDRR